MSITYPFDEEDIVLWLTLGRQDCLIDNVFQDSLDGTRLDTKDLSTYWNQPRQFSIWWKNNVERRKKFASLEKDATYVGFDPKLLARKLFCGAVVAICSNIKAYFERKITKFGDVILTNIPIQMPSHMPVPVQPLILSNRPRFKHRKSPVVRSEEQHFSSSSSSSFSSSSNPPKCFQKRSTKELSSSSCLDTTSFVQNDMSEEQIQQYVLSGQSEIDIADTIRLGLKQAGSHLDSHVPSKMPRVDHMEYGAGK